MIRILLRKIWRFLFPFSLVLLCSKNAFGIQVDLNASDSYVTAYSNVSGNPNNSFTNQPLITWTVSTSQPFSTPVTTYVLAGSTQARVHKNMTITIDGAKLQGMAGGSFTAYIGHYQNNLVGTFAASTSSSSLPSECNNTPVCNVIINNNLPGRLRIFTSGGNISASNVTVSSNFFSSGPSPLYRRAGVEYVVKGTFPTISGTITGGDIQIGSSGTTSVSCRPGVGTANYTHSLDDGCLSYQFMPGYTGQSPTNGQFSFQGYIDFSQGNSQDVVNSIDNLNDNIMKPFDPNTDMPNIPTPPQDQGNPTLTTAILSLPNALFYTGCQQPDLPTFSGTTGNGSADAVLSELDPNKAMPKNCDFLSFAPFSGLRTFLSGLANIALIVSFGFFVFHMFLRSQEW